MCLTLLKIYMCFISSLNKLSKIVLIKADVIKCSLDLDKKLQRFHTLLSNSK